MKPTHRQAAISSWLQPRVALLWVLLIATTTACGSAANSQATPSATSTLATGCPTPGAAPNMPVSANVVPVPTPQPASSDETDYTLAVPPATETLVVKLDTNASSKDDLVPSFVGPDSTVVTRARLAMDSIVAGYGVSELMWIQSPKQGAWLLKLHDTTGRQFAIRLLVTALFHLHRPPIAKIKTSQTSGRAPLVVVFDAAGTQLDSASAVYCWMFTNGTSRDVAFGVKVSHTFSAPGTYHALLTVIDAEQGAGYNQVQVAVTS